MQYQKLKKIQQLFIQIIFASIFISGPVLAGAAPAPSPLLDPQTPVTWWVAYKLGSHSFPGCDADVKSCEFGGNLQKYQTKTGQQYIYASSSDGNLQKGKGCLGSSKTDPLSATYSQIYNNPNYFYVVWNDQFNGDPIPQKEDEWGHDKGMIAWNEAGEGIVLQVSTPSWPASGSAQFPRKIDGNTLGCTEENNLIYGQHFVAIKLNKDDVLKVLTALDNTSIATNQTKPQLVRNGGPKEIQDLVNNLGELSNSTTIVSAKLSTGITLISKPSKLHVPAWQMISAKLGGVNLRVASWWQRPEIFSTIASTKISCWDDSLGNPGAVTIATTGQWEGTTINLKAVGNHGKIGVSTDKNYPLVIFGSLNQQGSLSGPNCSSAQNGRGGIFYVINNNQDLFNSFTTFLNGDSAPVQN